MYKNCEQVNKALASIDQSFQSLSQIDQNEFEVVIINDSPFYKADIDTNFKFSIRIENLLENVGTGEARNIGFKIAKRKWVLSIDSDIEFRQDTLVKFYLWTKSGKTFDIVQSIVSDQPIGNDVSLFQKYLAISFYIDAITDNEVNIHPMLLNTMCFMANREKFISFGGFSSHYRGSGGEEFEITKRFKQIKIIQDEEILVDHNYEKFCQRMKKLLRRSANYKDVVFQNETFPKFLKKIAYLRALSSIGILASLLYLPLEFYPSLYTLILCIAFIVFCDSGRLFKYVFNKEGMIRCMMLIPFIMSEYLVVVLGCIVSSVRNDK